MRVLSETSLAFVDRVRLANRTTGEQTRYISTGLDGSFYGWLSPKYELTVEEPGEEPWKLSSRCGNHGGDYDATTMVTLAPGERVSWWLTTPYVRRPAARNSYCHRYCEDWKGRVRPLRSRSPWRCRHRQ